MSIPIDQLSIRTFLREAGMPETLSNRCAIQPVFSENLAVTFKVIFPESKIYYLKFSGAEGARGGGSLRHLLPIDDSATRTHAEKRRKFNRKLLDSVIQERHSLVPRPCYFDLQRKPMSLQRTRKEKEHVLSELRVDGESYPARLRGMVGTLWEGLDIEPLPLLFPLHTDLENPIEYSLENVFSCTATLAEFQTRAENFLNHAIEKKVRANKGSPEEIKLKLAKKLQHEQRSFIGFDVLINDFLSALGVQNIPLMTKKLGGGLGENAFKLKASLFASAPTLNSYNDVSDDQGALPQPITLPLSRDNYRNALIKDLKKKGEELLISIKTQVQSLQGQSIEALQSEFIESVALPKDSPPMSFRKVLFLAEREQWWVDEMRAEGKRLDQLQQAETIAKELILNPNQIALFIEDIIAFQMTYAELEKLPQAMVLQNAHPYHFSLNCLDGNISMLGLEDLSMEARIADLSTTYLFKILKAEIQKEITPLQANFLIQAAIQGYESKGQSLSSKEIKLIASYIQGSFLNLLPQFGAILRLDWNALNSYNLAMSFNSFLKHFQLLKEISALWDAKLKEFGAP